MGALAPTICNVDGCPRRAVERGRCTEHPRKPWGQRSPSSEHLNGAGRNAHRRARRAAAARAAGACERCGKRRKLQLHHPDPISHGGATVQPDAEMLCTDCHRVADRAAGARR